VLDRTHSAAVVFEEQMGAVNAALTGAAVQSSSQIVADAVTGLAQAQTNSVQFVFTRTNACITGAAEATKAYLEGDLEMAANAQAAADDAPVQAPPGPR
jgi:hypothetical protein